MKMRQFWDKYAPYWHICMAILTSAGIGLVWINNVSGYAGRIDSLEISQKKGEKRESRMDYNIQVIAQKLHVIYLKAPEDE